ncbi:MAG: DUF1566 domain-containing protein [bacterium]
MIIGQRLKRTPKIRSGIAALALLSAVDSAVGLDCGDLNLPALSESTPEIFHSEAVTDNANGIMWARCLLGQSGDRCEGGIGSQLSWVDALNSARGSEHAGFTNWRLPKLEELQTLVENCGDPVFNRDSFPGLTNSFIWSASANIDYATDAWAVDFTTGKPAVKSRDTLINVILIRSLE